MLHSKVIDEIVDELFEEVFDSENRNFTDELVEERIKENELNLISIRLHDGLCPICKKNIIDITDWEWDIGFFTQKRVYTCRKCGFVAREVWKAQW